jgi:hypothetical protein
MGETEVDITYLSGLPIGSGPFRPLHLGGLRITVVTSGRPHVDGGILAVDVTCRGLTVLDVLHAARHWHHHTVALLLRDVHCPSCVVLTRVAMAEADVVVARSLGDLPRALEGRAHPVLDAIVGAPLPVVEELQKLGDAEPLARRRFQRALEAAGEVVDERWFARHGPAATAIARAAARPEGTTVAGATDDPVVLPPLTFQPADQASTVGRPSPDSTVPLAYRRGAMEGHVDSPAYLNVSDDAPTPVYVRWSERMEETTWILRSEQIPALFVDLAHQETALPDTVHGVLGATVNGVDLLAELEANQHRYHEVPVILVVKLDDDLGFEAALEVIGFQYPHLAGAITDIRGAGRALSEIRHSTNWINDVDGASDLLAQRIRDGARPPLRLHQRLRNDEVARHLVAAAVAGSRSSIPAGEAFDGEMQLFQRRLASFSAWLRSSKPDLVDSDPWSTIRDFAERNQAYLPGWIARYADTFRPGFLEGLWPDLRDVRRSS